MKLLLLASGTGSLAQSIIDAGFDIAAVVSDVSGAQVIDRAKLANIPSKVIEFKTPRENWDQELIKFVSTVNPDLVVSVGFLIEFLKN